MVNGKNYNGTFLSSGGSSKCKFLFPPSVSGALRYPSPCVGDAVRWSMTSPWRIRTPRSPPPPPPPPRDLQGPPLPRSMAWGPRPPTPSTTLSEGQGQLRSTGPAAGPRPASDLQQLSRHEAKLQEETTLQPEERQRPTNKRRTKFRI